MAVYEGLVTGSRSGGAVIMALIPLIGGAFGIRTATGSVEGALLHVISKDDMDAHLLNASLFFLFSLRGPVIGMGEEVIPFVLMLLTDDLVHTAFSGAQFHPSRRPLNLHFGEVIDYYDFGGFDLDDLGDLHASGTFESTRIVDDTTRPVPALSGYGLGLAVSGLFMFAAFAFRRMA